MIYLEQLTNFVDAWAKYLSVCIMRQRARAYTRKLMRVHDCIDREEQLHDRMLESLRLEINSITGKMEAARVALQACQAQQGGAQ
jgi:thiaminase